MNYAKIIFSKINNINCLFVYLIVLSVFIIGVSCSTYKKTDIPVPSIETSSYTFNSDTVIRNYTYNDIVFSDINTGWAVGNVGRIITTNDAGVTWTSQISGTVETLRSLCFVSSTTGWIVGNKGVILKTIDAGATWMTQISGVTNDIYGVHFISDQNGFAVTSTGVVLKTIDGGTTWTKKTISGVTDLRAISMLHADTVYATGAAGALVKTVDGGTTWTVLPAIGASRYNDLHFPTASIGYACGQSGFVYKIDRKNNDMITRMVLPVNDQQLGLFFTSETTGYVVGQYAELAYTNDGGLTWMMQNVNPITITLRGVHCPAPDALRVVGNGIFIKQN